MPVAVAALVEGVVGSLDVEADADGLELADDAVGSAEEATRGDPALFAPVGAERRPRMPGRAAERELRDVEAAEDASETEESAAS